FRFEHVDYDHATSLIVESTDHAPLAQPLSPQLAAEAELVDVGDVHLIDGASVRGRVLARDHQSCVPNAFLIHQQMSVGNTCLPGQDTVVGKSAAGGRFSLDHLRPTDLEVYPQEDHLFAIAEKGIGWASVRLLPDREPGEGVELVLAETRSLVVNV